MRGQLNSGHIEGECGGNANVKVLKEVEGKWG